MIEGNFCKIKKLYITQIDYDRNYIIVKGNLLDENDNLISYINTGFSDHQISSFNSFLKEIEEVCAKNIFSDYESTAQLEEELPEYTLFNPLDNNQ